MENIFEVFPRHGKKFSIAWKTRRLFFHTVENRGKRAGRRALSCQRRGRGVWWRSMKYRTHLVVRTYECDSNGHVNHAVYVNYLEHARGELLSAGGIDYHAMQRAGFGFVIVKLEMTYHGPAFAGDALVIVSEPVETKRASGVIRQRVFRGGEGGEVLAEAMVTWCAIDAAGRPVRLPAEFDMRRLGGAE